MDEALHLGGVYDEGSAGSVLDELAEELLGLSNIMLILLTTFLSSLLCSLVPAWSPLCISQILRRSLASSTSTSKGLLGKGAFLGIPLALGAMLTSTINPLEP